MEKKGSVYPPVNGKGGNNQVKLMHVLTYIDRAKLAKSVTYFNSARYHLEHWPTSQAQAALGKADRANQSHWARL